MAKRLAPAPAPAPVRAPVRRAPVQSAAQPAAPSAAIEEYEARLAVLEAEREQMRLQTEAERARASRLEKQNRDFSAKQAEAERAARAERIRYTAMRIATKFSAIDPEDVADLIERKLALDATGNVVDAADAARSGEDVIKAFIEAKPHLARPQTASGSGAAPPAPRMPGAPVQAKHDMRTAEGQQASLREAVERLTSGAKPS
jgi:hypothetical protein